MKKVMLTVALAVLLTAAGCTGNVRQTSKAGAISIKYDSAVLARAPVFSESDGVIHMSFSGYEWYTAQIITEAEKTALVEGREVLAETSNMKLYDTSDEECDAYQYTCLFEPEGAVDSYVRFDTDDFPDNYVPYGLDFANGIRYYVNNTEVIPDIPMKDDTLAEAPTPHINLIKQRYPEYFGLDMEKGLEIYAWQYCEEYYAFALLEKTENEREEETLWRLNGTTVGEMGAILADYGITEETAEIVLYNRPSSNFVPEYAIVYDGESDESVEARRQAYIDDVRRMLFEE